MICLQLPCQVCGSTTAYRIAYFSRNWKQQKYASQMNLLRFGFTKIAFLLNVGCNFKIYSKTKRNAGKGHNSNTINLKLMIKRFVMLVKCCINNTKAHQISTKLNLLLSWQGALYQVVKFTNQQTPYIKNTTTSIMTI